ncbi:heparanase [Tribolium castaneum]|uniref:Heparanase-like Protein n=1 Tax=Tribolium castaneum TaxID=7070 RepID=A0A139WIE2_TRICA|nr:PREDICTED: heparanase-like isoform X2 [Tribolium castaneum]KYB27768.1 Heparanase-like Protein [Tribolium castaneum]|eukprot:XP_008191575.1 PREDICTED: heparanase-like isoform X2 [Tribolium castaneum]
MFVMFEDNFFQQYTPRLKSCGNVCTILSVTLCFITVLTLLAIFAVDLTQKVHIVYIGGAAPKHITNEKFLSVALDASVIANGFKHFDLKSEKVIKLMKALSPAYLRIGGTMADRLIFSTTESLHFKHLGPKVDGGECSYEERYCDALNRPNFTMNSHEWLQLNELAQKTNLEIIFDLNSLRRFDDGAWDYTNAETLIRFSSQHNLNVNWELGNEPNAYRHQFDYEVQPAQLAHDFQTLRNILQKYPLYQKSLVVGPDVTRPQNTNNQSRIYLSEFLKHGIDVIDAVTWHQYYFNGATAKVGDFLDVRNFDVLQWQIDTIKDIVHKEGVKKIWLGETSSAYGGGAPHLSNRYIATFLWLDKLGLAAKNGLDVVIRQSIYAGNYALINCYYNPSPDWWVSILYKKLVAPKVVECRLGQSERVRLYCQCTPVKSYFDNKPSVTVFGLNLHNRKAKIRFEGITPAKDLKVNAYVLTTVERIDSRFIFLNNRLLQLNETHDVPNLLPVTIPADPYVEMPPFSLGFWVVPITSNVLPYC